MSDVRKRSRGRWTLVALMALFGLPFVAAVWLFLNPDLLPQATANKGELIVPSVAVADTPLQGDIKNLHELRGRWVMLLLLDAVCDEACVRRAYDLRQMRLAASVDRDRVERLLLFRGAVPARNDALAAFPRMHLASDAGRLRAELPETAVGVLVLIDPMGNAMLHYRPDQPAREILSDLKRLLKVSKEWVIAPRDQ